jgi:hypothetical protein
MVELSAYLAECSQQAVKMALYLVDQMVYLQVEMMADKTVDQLRAMMVAEKVEHLVGKKVVLSD